MSFPVCLNDLTLRRINHSSISIIHYSSNESINRVENNIINNLYHDIMCYIHLRHLPPLFYFLFFFIFSCIPFNLFTNSSFLSPSSFFGDGLILFFFSVLFSLLKLSFSVVLMVLYSLITFETRSTSSTVK